MVKTLVLIAIFASLPPIAGYGNSRSLVPGIDSGVDSQRMIDEIMEQEGRRKERMHDDIERFEFQRRVWGEIARDLNSLRDSARRLYGFENPFNLRTAESSDSQVLTASASRQAERGRAEIEVKQIARADAFRSGRIPLDQRIEAGTYRFTVGELEAEFEFDGGDVAAFTRELNRRIGDTVRARTVRDTRESQVILFESQITGAENRLAFHDAAEQLAEEFQVLERAPESARSVEVTDDPEQPLTVGPQDQASLSLEPVFALADGMVLEIEVEIVEHPADAWEPPEPPSGPRIPELGEVTLEDVTVQDAESRAPLPERPEPEPPEVIEDGRVFYVLGDGRRIQLPSLGPTDGYRTLRIPISEQLSEMSALEIVNRNTHREILIRAAEIYDPTAPGEFRPLNPVQIAQDARISIDGIEVTRDTNTIDDLIDGTTVYLHRPGPHPIELEIDHDRDAAKDAIIDFVGRYNQLIRDVNILTRTEESVIDQIEYFDDDERQQAHERLGLLQGDSILNRLRRSLQNMMMEPYPTREGDNLRLLAQIGVSSNASGFGGGVDASRLRGYLEINEATLDEALATRFQAVRDLFGFDSSGNHVIDAGAAYRAHEMIGPYTQSGGIIATRTGTIDGRVTRTEDDIEREEDRLDRREQSLRQDFGRMEGAMRELEEQQRAIENFSRQNAPQGR